MFLWAYVWCGLVCSRDRCVRYYSFFLLLFFPRLFVPSWLFQVLTICVHALSFYQKVVGPGLCFHVSQYSMDPFYEFFILRFWNINLVPLLRSHMPLSASVPFWLSYNFCYTLVFVIICFLCFVYFVFLYLRRSFYTGVFIMCVTLLAPSCL